MLKLPRKEKKLTYRQQIEKKSAYQFCFTKQKTEPNRKKPIHKRIQSKAKKEK
jgi:hypothetical protein